MPRQFKKKKLVFKISPHLDEVLRVLFGKYSFPLLFLQIPKKNSLQLNLITLIEAADIRVAGNIYLNISGTFASDLFASKAMATAKV